MRWTMFTLGLPARICSNPLLVRVELLVMSIRLVRTDSLTFIFLLRRTDIYEVLDVAPIRVPSSG